MAESNNTAVATTSTAEHPEVAAIRQAGAVAVERQKTLTAFQRQLQGMKWGDVAGSSLSNATAYAIAEMCRLTGADPQLHLYILGGRPYLNAEYWKQVVAGHPYTVRSYQVNISAGHSAALRALAKEAEADGDMEEAVRYRREAREADRLRSHYGVPDKAEEAYETIIVRYVEHAPLAGIRMGTVDPTPFLQEVREANYAPNAGRDPVGTARPAETARSRSMRRCATGAFATTLAPVEQKLKALEAQIEEGFADVVSSQALDRAALPSGDGPQGLRIGAGEPMAAAAPPLVPVEAEPAPAPSRSRARGAQASAPPLTPVEDPAVAAARQQFEGGCRALGIDDAERFIADHLGHAPVTADDYATLNRVLRGIGDGEIGELPL